MEKRIYFCLLFILLVSLSLINGSSYADESMITYGNYGYRNYTGGGEPTNYFPTDFNEPAIDSLDELFKKHDQTYWAANEMGGEKGKRFRKEADCELLKGLLNLQRIKISNWEKPPPSRDQGYAKIYLEKAIKVFRLMCAFRSRGSQ